jgi:fructose-1,6-bisphosphatase/inositol monophosphatase family enzyme
MIDSDIALETALKAAKTADDIMMRYRGTGYKTYSKAGARGRAEAVLTEPDLLCDEAVVSILSGEHPDSTVVSEESYESLPSGWSNAEWIWYVDPIDGSLSYLEGGKHFGVSIALTHRGEPVLGVITNPALELTAWGVVGQRAFINGNTISLDAPAREKPQLILSVGQNKSRSYKLAMEYLEPESLILKRSVVSKTMSVLMREADYYFSLPYDVFHGGQPNIWDLAGSAAIVLAAGGAATDFYGDPLVFPGTDVKWPKGHIIANPRILRQILPRLNNAIVERKRLEAGQPAIT